LALFGVEGWIVAAPFINTSRLQQKRQQLSFFKSRCFRKDRKSA
jgi:hypothetical protein